MTSKYDVAVLHACPLDYQMMQLDIAAELACLKSALSNSRKKIKFISSFATVGDFSAIVSMLYCTCV